MIAVQLYSLSAFTHGRLEHWQINNLAILGANSGSPAQAEGCLCPNSLLRDPENSGWGQQELGRGVPWGIQEASMLLEPLMTSSLKQPPETPGEGVGGVPEG